MFKLIKKIIKWSLISVVGLFTLATILAFSIDDITPEQLAAREQARIERALSDALGEAVVAAAEVTQAAEERRNGFHCLSSWDGSHRGVKNNSTDRLRDPDSFEHIETLIWPVNVNGEHALIMKYRARNGFGGMNAEYVKARVNNKTCSATIYERS